MKKLLLLLLVLGLCVSCAKRKVATKPEEAVQPEAKQEEVQVQEAQPEAVTPAKPEEITQAALAQEIENTQYDSHFAFDRYDIKPEDKPTLKKVSELLSRNAKVTVLIEGHCDDRGTNDYNLGLGERRANAAKSYLMTLGVPTSKIRTLSYGEERPVCTEANEGCWSRNRRAHFTIATE